MAVIELIRNEETGTDQQWISVPVTKASAKGEPAFIKINLDALPPDVYTELLLQGAKTIVNRGMSGVTGAKTEKSKAIASEIAERNVNAMYEGKVRLSSGVRTKVKTGAINTEAMRLARVLIRDTLKAAGEKVSHYSAKAITELAKEYLESDDGQDLVAQAAENIKAREEQEKASKAKIDISKIKPDPKLVEASKLKSKKARAPVPQRAVAQHANR